METIHGAIGPHITLQKPTEQYTRVSHDEINLLHKNHFRSQWPAMARRTLLDMILKDEPKFTINKTEVQTHEINPLFREIIRNHYMPFLVDCFDEIMILGLVIVRIVKLPTGDLVPKVISSLGLNRWFELRIYPDYETGQPTYKVFKTHKKDGTPLSGQPRQDSKAFIFTGAGTPPALDGTLRSVVASLSEWQTYYDRMMIFSNQADYNLSDPTILTEVTPEAPGLPNIEHDTPTFTPNDPIADLEGVYARDFENRRHVHRHVNLQFDQTRPWQPDGTLRLKKSQHHNVISLPVGHRMAANAGAPVRRNDLNDIIATYQTLVSAAYGVPRAALVQDTSFRTAGSSMLIENSMRHTLSMWSRIMTTILTTTMRCIYYPEDCNEVFGIMPTDKDGMSVKELFKEAAQIARVEVHLRVAPAVDLRELYFLYHAGIVTWDELVTQARVMKGLPVNEIPEEPAPPLVASTSDTQGVTPQGSTSEGGGDGAADQAISAESNNVQQLIALLGQTIHS
jgi:hypothetical protein